MKYFTLIIASLFLASCNEYITIYTPKEIIYYYPFTTTVTFETKQDKYHFMDTKSAAQFIETTTADHCNEAKKYQGEYQINLDFDTIRIYQYGRFVGQYIVKDKLNELDSILVMDNL